MSELVKLIKELSELEGVPGFEHEVRANMEKHLTPLSNEIVKDRLGSIVGKKTGEENGPRILLAGHLDEIGWMVTQITDKGYIRFQQLGGWWPHVLPAHRVKVKTRKGDYIGVIGSKAPHVLAPEEISKVMKMKDMFIDVGARDKEDAEKMGIRPGDAIVPVSEFFTMRDGELWAGKALDNRAGCAVAIEVLKRLQKENHPNVVFSGATVMEEVGTRGAATLANVVKPDISFAVDVGLAYDTPGAEAAGTAKAGEGPLLFIFDAMMIPHVGLRNLVMDTAEELGIKYQTDALPGGGTDAAKFHLNGNGCPSLAIGFAVRYIHTHTAVMARKDFEQVVDLLVAVIKKLDKQTVEQLVL